MVSRNIPLVNELRSACQKLAATVLGPLSFPEPEAVRLPFAFAPWENAHVQCVFCPVRFLVPKDVEGLSTHLYDKHSLLVADLCSLASIQGLAHIFTRYHLIKKCFNGEKATAYVDYWRVRFTQVPVAEMCTSQLSPDERVYYLLSPETNHEDLSLRQGLNTKRLEWVLDRQRRERAETQYGRGCLFCRYIENGTRAHYITHLADQHNLQLGRPHNIVFVDQLIDKLEAQLKQLKCIYCELVFRDRDVLKEHMRKKFHKRINPNNNEYDRFYVNSYVEGGKETGPRDEDCSAADWSQWREEGSDWSDWQEEPPPIVCLFCPQSYAEWDNVLTHMHDAHRFSYTFVMGKCNYYQQVKIVNFIRREVHLGRCYECKAKFADETALTQHMNEKNHCTLPDRSDWDHPEFFFPTYENDSFLSSIQDNEEDPVERLATQFGADCGVVCPANTSAAN